MSNTITILGHDPSLTNWGMCLATVDVTTMEIVAAELALHETAPAKNKQVRVASDNLARARKLAHAFQEWEAKAHINAAEIPTGAQSAKASYAFGLVVGVLAAHRKPLIEVTPTEVKKCAIGYSTASKQEMIEWGTELMPGLNWLRRGGKLLNKNEHLADALAIVYTAIRTEQFKTAAAMFAANAAA